MTDDILQRPALTAVTDAIDAVRRGEVVVVVDSEDRENEGDLIMAAEAATPEKIAFFLRHTSGVLCAATTGERLDTLHLPLMVQHNEESHQTAFTVSVDVARGITTGISAADRARTLAALADPTRSATDFVRPGHVFPLRAKPGGVLERPGHTEAAVDLTRLAGMAPTAVLSEIVTKDHSGMARVPELRVFAEEHGLVMVSIEQLAAYRARRGEDITCVARARIPTVHGEFACRAWHSASLGAEHIAFVLGDPSGPEPVLTRIHSECLTGDIFGSMRCDCGDQLEDALACIGREKRGILIYLRGHEGRGIGLADKLRTYELQDRGYDTVDANLELGLPVDSRTYLPAVRILGEMGVTSVRLITNNPRKSDELREAGIDVAERVVLPPRPNSENADYLQSKRIRMGHDFSTISRPVTTPFGGITDSAMSAVAHDARALRSIGGRLVIGN